MFKRISIVQITFFAYAVLVIILSLTPSQGVNDYGFLDKIFHFMMYFLLAFLALMAFQTLWARIIAIPFAYGIGFILEWAQGFTDNRTPSIGDNMANFLGVSLGIIVYFLWWKKRDSRIKERVD